MDFVIDFDGTVVKHTYPKVGEDVPGAVDVLKKLINGGHNIILYTMRGDEELKDAIKWYEDKGIPLYGVNVHPTQHEWTNSPKAYAEYSIDDRNIGCPLLQDYKQEPYVNGLLGINGEKPDYNKQSKITPIGRPYVDWAEIDKILNKFY